MAFTGGLGEETTEPELRRAALGATLPGDAQRTLTAYNAAVQTRLSSEAQQRLQRFPIRETREHRRHLELAQVSGDMEFALAAAAIATDLSAQNASKNALTNSVLTPLVTTLDVAHDQQLQAGPQMTAGVSLGFALRLAVSSVNAMSPTGSVVGTAMHTRYVDECVAASAPAKRAEVGLFSQLNRMRAKMFAMQLTVAYSHSVTL